MRYPPDAKMHCIAYIFGLRWLSCAAVPSVKGLFALNVPYTAFGGIGQGIGGSLFISLFLAGAEWEGLTVWGTDVVCETEMDDKGRGMDGEAVVHIEGESNGVQVMFCCCNQLELAMSAIALFHWSDGQCRMQELFQQTIVKNKHLCTCSFCFVKLFCTFMSVCSYYIIVPLSFVPDYYFSTFSYKELIWGQQVGMM